MPGVKLYAHQIEAVRKMKKGCVLNGGVGSGKSITSLAFYYILNGGKINTDGYTPMSNPSDLYIITTAKKRDSLEWDEELGRFLLCQDPKVNHYNNKVVVDSWNNIQKYVDIKDAFFIFDEQRVVGYGAWTKSFLKITRNNFWILLSATPGDTVLDYMPVMIANGFYKNKTDFISQHIIYDPYAKFPKVKEFKNLERFQRLRNHILIDMDYDKHSERHHFYIKCDYNKKLYFEMMRNRWNPWKEEPMQNAAELCYSVRRVVNEDESRQVYLLELLEDHPKVIIFYNYDYELEILRGIAYPKGTELAEWNGHHHQPIPVESDKWVYLVQYTAGCEGWSCIKTDTIIFYSQNYSYKMMEQACGRIDRLNTPFHDLNYYHLVSNAPIDRAIGHAIGEKKKFNENRFVKW